MGVVMHTEMRWAKHVALVGSCDLNNFPDYGFDLNLAAYNSRPLRDLSKPIFHRDIFSDVYPVSVVDPEDFGVSP